MTQKAKSILIIGAGIAGLSAARTLQEKGYQNIKILEARDRIGGRIWTNQDLGLAIDLGASWIHGNHPDNPIMQLAKKLMVNTFELDEEETVVFNAKGKEYTDKKLFSKSKAYAKLLDKIEEKGEENKSIKDLILKLKPKALEDPLMLFFLSSDLEFDFGNDIDRLCSLHYESDEEFEGENLMITHGYRKILDYLAKDLTIELGQKVRRINYGDDRVVVKTMKDRYVADYVICTVPLGVLKANSIHFIPELPAVKKTVLDRMEMGNLNKVVLTFKKSFWHREMHYLAITPKEKGRYNYFLNYKKINAHPTLMTFAFGHFAKEMEHHSDEKVVEAVMKHLKVMYGADISQPVEILRSGWTQDPFSLGAYSAAVVGMEEFDFETVAHNLQNKVFFAGEHTSQSYRGTVHGAYLSGQEVAEEVLEAMEFFV